MTQTESPAIFSFVDWTHAPDDLDTERFGALSSFMLVALVSHCGMLVGRESELGTIGTTVFLPAYVLCAITGVTSPRAKPYCLWVSFAVTSAWLFMAWPSFANHLMLEWSVLLFLTVCRAEPALGMKAVRWLIVVVLFHSGFQKFVIGQYFEGTFLAFNTATIENFRDFMRFFLSEGEFNRLIAMEGRPGTGPYAVSDPVFVAIANLVWIGEMGIALLLIPLRTRMFAVVAGLGLILSIELGARELIFGCLFASMVISFVPRKNALAIWPGLAALSLASMLAFHLMPELRLN